MRTSSWAAPVLALAVLLGGTACQDTSAEDRAAEAAEAAEAAARGERLLAFSDSVCTDLSKRKPGGDGGVMSPAFAERVQSVAAELQMKVGEVRGALSENCSDYDVAVMNYAANQRRAKGVPVEVTEPEYVPPAAPGGGSSTDGDGGGSGGGPSELRCASLRLVYLAKSNSNETREDALSDYENENCERFE